MNTPSTHQQIEHLWERAVERASEEMLPRQELAEQNLNEIAGMRVKSGAKAGGLWGATNGCSASATCPCGTGGQ